MPAPRTPTDQMAPRSERRAATVVAALACALALLAACGSGSTPSATGPADTAPVGASSATGTVTVFAAASLKEAFTEIGQAFEAANPDASVTFDFAASSTLAQQIQEGAPADVYASADEANMQKVVDAEELRGDPTVFATNSLRIIVAAGNPKGITSLDDLSSSDVLYVTAAPEVPIGRYAAQVLESADVTVSPVSLEADVKAVVAKVTSGEADAGIVYATDVTAAGDQADGIDVPGDVDVVATYPLGVTKEAANADGAAAWVAFVTGPEGQAILARYGFGAP